MHPIQSIITAVEYFSFTHATERSTGNAAMPNYLSAGEEFPKCSDDRGLLIMQMERTDVYRVVCLQNDITRVVQ